MGQVPQRIDPPHSLPNGLDQRTGQSQYDKGQQQRIDVPAQQQREARLHQQLAEATLLHKQHHAVEDEEDAKKVGARVGGHHVVVRQAVG